MNKQKTTLCLTMAAALLAFQIPVKAAQSGVDYGGYKLFVDIAATQPDAPTVITGVSVVCPEAGSLISTASAQITMNTGGAAGEVDVQYGISKNTNKAQINYHHLLRQYTDSGTTFGTAHFQRIDSCTAGQTVKLFFVAHRLGAASASAEKASLVVTFISDPRI